jgi:hypothetical protein
MVSARDIRGRTIVGIRYTTWPNGRSSGGPLHTEVRIDLDDGSALLFDTEESRDGGTYGTFVYRVNAGD